MLRHAIWTLALVLATTSAHAAPPPVRSELPTGQALTPLAAPGARYTPLVAGIGPFPAYVADGASAVATSPDGATMLVLTSGFNRFNGPDGRIVPGQSLDYIFVYRIDGPAARRVQTLTIPNSFGGIAWLPDGSGFIAGGGVDDTVHVYRHGPEGFVERTVIALGHKAGLGAAVKPEAAGVTVSPDGTRALVTNYYNDSVSLLDLATGRVLAERDLRPGTIDPAMAGQPGGEFPFAVSWTDARHAWVSSPRDRQLVALTIGTDTVAVTGRVATVGEPTALFADRAGNRLIATEDNADRIALLDLATGRMVGEPRLTLPGAGDIARGVKGLNPNALAMLPDGRLLVTLGGINALAVLTHDAARIDGLIPTGWYPSGVAVAPGGRRLLVINRKSPPGANPQGCAPRLAIYRGQPSACGAANQYIFQLEKAGLLELPLPGARTLAATTLQVARNINLPAAAARAAAARTMAAIRARIRHVIFIIKENRTYDQVLGDLPIGNGDPHLAILGRALSPNHHALAQQFVTLDNFYDSGEQSSTGWTWTTAARTTDMLEKTAAPNYAQRGLAYEAEEADRFVYTQQTPAERHATNPALSADPDLLAGPALLTAPDPADDDRPGQGFLWDAALRAGLTVRNYGFSDASVYDTGAAGAVPLIRDPHKAGRRVYTPGDRLLAPVSDPYFRGFDQKMPDYWRELEWERDYGNEERAGKLPRLTLLRLSHDHFGDFKDAIDGVNTVETEMADNDYALGRVVERVAHGKAAASTLIFVIEDDAQNGADHVDARRSIAFVVGPYVRHGALVSTRYTTVSMLRTIEAVLGLRPLGLNDALATPMADLFDLAQRSWTFRAHAAPVLATTKLPIPADRFTARQSAALTCPGRSSAWWAHAMAGQDFSHEDRLDTAAFNAALWRGLATGAPPKDRSGADLSANRVALLDAATAARTCPGG